MSIRDLYTEEEVREIQKLLKTSTKGKPYAILYYFLRWLLAQKRLVFTIFEFWRWCRKFTDISMDTTVHWLSRLTKYKMLRRIRTGIYRVENTALLTFGFVDLADLLGVSYDTTFTPKTSEKKEEKGRVA